MMERAFFTGGTGNVNNPEADNTWVIAGGRAAQGRFADIGPARSFAGQFEEYIRWAGLTGTDPTDDSCLPVTEARQRYVISTAYAGQTLGDVVSNFDRRIGPLDPRVAAYLVGAEDMADADTAAFKANLRAFVQKALALRGGAGFAVVMTPYAGSHEHAGAYARAVKEVADELGEACGNVAVVDAYGATAALEGWADACLTAEGDLNARGHLKLAYLLAKGTHKSDLAEADFPQYRGVPISDRFPHDFSTELTATRAYRGQAPAVLSAAQRAVAQKAADRETPMTWLFMGDSVTQGVDWMQGYASMVQYMERFIKDDLGRGRDIVFNTAVSGATARMTVYWLRERLEKYSPDVVSVMLGTNDAYTHMVPVERYRAHLEQIIDAILFKGAVAVLHTPLPNAGADRGQYIHEYAAAVRVVAAMEKYRGANIILIDHFARWTPHLMTGETGTGTRPLFRKIFNRDEGGIHPGTAGQLWMTHELIEGLGLWRDGSAICGLNYELG